MALDLGQWSPFYIFLTLKLKRKDKKIFSPTFYWQFFIYFCAVVVAVVVAGILNSKRGLEKKNKKQNGRPEGGYKTWPN